MPTEGFNRLISRAKEDPQFFHDLVWSTDKVMGSIDYLSREEKASILAIKPEDLIVGLATGSVFGPRDLVAACGGTCGASCGASCGGSCGGSCTATCAASCPLTGLKPGDLEQVINPADLNTQINEQLAPEVFTRFRRG
jgi:hypothetical protein